MPFEAPELTISERVEMLNHTYRHHAAMPVLRKAGDVVLERSGTVHWWHNQSNLPVKAIVVEIVPDALLEP